MKNGKQDWGELMEKEIRAVVDITEKLVIKRTAKATGLLKISKTARTAIINDGVKKGNVIEASTIAAIQAILLGWGITLLTYVFLPYLYLSFIIRCVFGMIYNF